ncbi:anti-sigma factor family protein [Luteimonas terricola]|uniref:Anti-sigma factor n=1 Tax=Luteimonas terricola TaxID=645597 RepID=A0ABQ2E8M5_9GAMM|nr:zf-HC2 domain-containing protein [Luteimonas terricola]GGK01152.1 anti-sigma factor [Luteimonas terricola]
MKIDDQALMAYADGELDPAEAARVEAMVASDPGLAEELARHRALQRRLSAAFDDMLDEPVPGHLLAAARGGDRATGGATGISAASPRREAHTQRRRSWPRWGAMAASLLLGVLLAQGFHAHNARTDPLVVDAGGRLHAQGRLAEALEARLASEPEATAEVSIGISFRDAGGRYCRSFVLRGKHAQAGLACRGEAGWQVPVTSEVAAAPGGELRLASTPLPAAVVAELDARIEGEPLDADAERAARAAGWRR